MATKIVTVKGRLRKDGTRGPSRKRKMKRIRNKKGLMQWVFMKGKVSSTNRARKKATKKAAKKRSKSSKKSNSGGNRTTKAKQKIPVLTTAGVGIGLWNLFMKLKAPIIRRDVSAVGRQFIHAIFAYDTKRREFSLEQGGGLTLMAPLAGWSAGKIITAVGKGKIGQGIPFIALR